MAVSTLDIQSIPTGNAPQLYTVPGSQSFVLVGVRAVFDGTGAGSAFLPCVQIKSAAGHVMQQVTGSSVAAGGSSDVTFGSFLEGAVAATPSGSVLNQQLTWSTAACPPTNVRGANFVALSGSSLFDVSGGNTGAPKCLTAGAYIITVNSFAAAGAGWTAGSTYLLTLTFAGAEFIQRLSVGPNGVATVVALDTFNAPWQFATNDTFTLDVTNGDSANSHTWSGDCLIQQVG